MSILPEDTASGSVASFPDGADDLPIGVVVDIDPVQDLHGYDNPWPGGGGRNKLPNNAVTSTIQGVTFTVNSDGTITANGTSTGWAGLTLSTFTLPAGEYTIQGNVRNQIYNFYISLYIDGTAVASTKAVSERNFSISETKECTCRAFARPSMALSNVVLYPMILLASETDTTSYTPYSNICPISGWTKATIYHSGADTSNPTEHEIPFSTEVYGGTLNVETGELVVDRKTDIADGSTIAIQGIYGNGTAYTAPIACMYPDISYAYQREARILSDKLKASPFISIASNQYAVAHSGGNRAVFNIPTCTTVAEYNAWLSENRPQMVYYLAAPITLTLDPVEIRSLFGDNNVWADTGNTSVTYLADVQKYIDKKISAAVAAMS